MIVLVETTETANNRKIRISVRNLVEFVLRGGDIDSRQTGSAQKNAMEAGAGSTGRSSGPWVRPIRRRWH